MHKRYHSEVGLPGLKSRTGFSPLTNILFMLCAVWLTSQVITQYVAAYYNYSSGLGEHYKHLYLPWKFFVWSHKWYHVHSTFFEFAWNLWGLGIGMFFLLYVVAAIVHTRSSKTNAILHGSAKWASKSDIIEAALLENEGVYIGGWAKKRLHNKKKRINERIYHLRHNGPEHVLAIAPTRSGKGVGLVLPTLLSWKESVVCLDIKGENWALSSGWRQKYARNACLRFDPSESDTTKTIAYNPIEQIRFGTEFEIGDVQNLALMMVDPNGNGLTDHWQKSAYAVLQMLIIHCHYQSMSEKGRPTCLSEVRKYFMDPSMEGLSRYEKMLAYPHHEDGSTHELVAQLAQSIIDTPEEERGSVITTTKTFLELYADPIVSRNTRHSDFKVTDLMQYQNPVSLYLVIRPSDKHRFIPLLRIVVTQIIRVLTEKMEFREGQSIKNYKHRLLLMLDEFPALKKMDTLQEGLAYMAGYGIKAYLIIQDLAQLYTLYGKDETITSNCHVQIAYAPNKNATAEYISRKTGVTTVVKEFITVSGKRISAILGNVSTSIHEVQRPLLTVDEVMRIPMPYKTFHRKGEETLRAAGDMLIFIAGRNPIYGRQILYFKDAVFLARARVAEPETLDRLYSRVRAAIEVEKIFDEQSTENKTSHVKKASL